MLLVDTTLISLKYQFQNKLITLVKNFQGEVIGGGFLRAPEIALPAIANNKTSPPKSVFNVATSFRNR
jgi:hypothetical protein